VAAALAWVVLLSAGLLVEWGCCPRQLRPGRVAYPRDLYFALVLFVLAGVGLLVWKNRGRLLLGLTGGALVVVGLGALCRWQAALALTALLWLLAVSAGLGWRCLRWLRATGHLTIVEKVCLATALGLGALAALTLGLGLGHRLDRGTVFGALALLTALALREAGALGREAAQSLGACLRAAREADLRWPAAAAALVVLCFTGALLWALADEVSYDGMMYHLAFPSLYAARGGLFEAPEAAHSYFCHLAEALYTLALVVVGQPLPQLLHLSAGLLVLGLVFAMGSRVGGPRTACLAALLFYALPLVSWESQFALTDLFLTLYVLAAFQAFTVWLTSGTTPFLALAGGFAGLAVSTKLSALLFVTPFAGLLTFYVFRGPGGWARRLQNLAAAALPLAACAAPWLLLEWHRTGNPVFPFYNAYFQSPKWDWVNEQFNFGWYGMGRGVRNFLLLPWHLATRPIRFGEGSWGALEGLTLACLPVTYFLWPKATRRVANCYLILTVLSLALWFRSVQYLRYLLPLVPLLVVLAAVNISTITAVLPRAFPRRTGLAALFLAAGLCWFAGTRWWSMKWNWHIPEHYPVRLVLGLETSEDFLRRCLPEYDALRLLAEEGERSATRVVAFPQHQRLYGGSCVFYHRLFTRLGRRLTVMPPGPALAEALAENRINFILLNQDVNYEVEPGLRCGLSDPGFLRRYCSLELVTRRDCRRQVSLYRFLGASPQGR
jgi:hypothetical protein